MAPTAGMLRYNTDNKYFERSINEGSSFVELDLSGETLIPASPEQTFTEQSVTTTGNITDLVLVAKKTYLRLNNASLSTIKGMVPFSGAGDICIISSVGAGQVDLSHQDTGEATAARRLINFATTGKTSLSPGAGSAIFVYDGTTARWRLIQHEQGATIAQSYSSGNFTGNGSMTWTVDSGDVDTFVYYLKGKILTITFIISTSSIGGTVNTNLQITIPGGFTANINAVVFLYLIDNGGTPTVGRCQVSVSGTIIKCQKIDLSNWTLSTNNASAYGQISVEVQ